MTAYILKYSGNCPVVERASATVFSIEPAIATTDNFNVGDLSITSGITNTILGQPTELVFPGADAYPQSLDTFEARAIDAVKRMFISGVCDIKAGDIFYFEDRGNAHDAMPPSGHDFLRDRFAVLSEPNKSLLVTVLSDTTLSIHHDAQAVELFDKSKFAKAVMQYCAVPTPGPEATEDVTEVSPAGRSAQIIPLCALNI